MPEIRMANKNDIDAVAALYEEQFKAMAELQPYFFQEGAQSRDFIENVIDNAASDILVCTVDGEIRAFALIAEKTTPAFPFFVAHRYAYLMDIAASEGERGKGFGGALMKAAKQWAAERQLEYIELDVLANNSGAVRFYERHGFFDKRRSMICRL